MAGVEPDSLGPPAHEVHDDEDDDPDDEIPDRVAFDEHLHRLMEALASPAQAADPSMRTAAVALCEKTSNRPPWWTHRLGGGNGLRR